MVIRTDAIDYEPLTNGVHLFFFSEPKTVFISVWYKN